MQLSIEDHTTTLIGKSEEKSILQDLLDSNQAEFLAIYGRRRIGKTFLIKEYFKDKEIVFFNSTGSKDGLLKNQIKHFTGLCCKFFLKRKSVAILTFKPPVNCL